MGHDFFLTPEDGQVDELAPVHGASKEPAGFRSRADKGSACQNRQQQLSEAILTSLQCLYLPCSCFTLLPCLTVFARSTGNSTSKASLEPSGELRIVGGQTGQMFFPLTLRMAHHGTPIPPAFPRKHAFPLVERLSTGTDSSLTHRRIHEECAPFFQYQHPCKESVCAQSEGNSRFEPKKILMFIRIPWVKATKSSEAVSLLGC